jgi:transposase
VPCADEERVARLVRQHPDVTLNVLRELLADEGAVAVSETTMWRPLVRMGLWLKMTLRAIETNRRDLSRMVHACRGDAFPATSGDHLCNVCDGD